MDHKAFIADLPSDTVGTLNNRTNSAALWHLASHMAVIAALGLWIALKAPLWQLVLVPQGIALIFLFTLEHEATHKTPFATEWINEWAGHLIGFLIVNPFLWFRYFHLAHHRHTNVPERDPELIAGAKPETRSAYALYVTGLPYWWGMAAQLIRNARGRTFDAYIPDPAKARITREARIMLALYALAAASLTLTPVLIWTWIVPVVLGQPFLRLYLLAEHGRCAYVANMFENTRTTYTNRAVRWLAWNMPYHVEHHTMPDVPFHQLPKLNALVQGHHTETAPGYAAFTSDYARHLH